MLLLKTCVRKLEEESLPGTFHSEISYVIKITEATRISSCTIWFASKFKSPLIKKYHTVVNIPINLELTLCYNLT